MRGLFIGRFQPFHNGHLAIVKQMERECDVLMIGVGSAQIQRIPDNPFSGGERITMIRKVMEAEGISDYEIYPIPDIHCYPEWPHYIHSMLPSFDRVYARSSVVKKLMGNIDVELVDIEAFNRDIWKGTLVREKMYDGVEWKHLVPPSVADYIEGLDINLRCEPLTECSENPVKRVAHLLTKKGLTVATAESCTGGTIAQYLTSVPGASMYFVAGVISYSDQSKTDLLKVDANLIREHGAVSEPVARCMAENVRERMGVDIGISTTGIAGPGGATKVKRVGTVYTGMAMEQNTSVEIHHFKGDRQQVIQQTAEAVFNQLVDILE